MHAVRTSILEVDGETGERPIFLSLTVVVGGVDYEWIGLQT